MASMNQGSRRQLPPCALPATSIIGTLEQMIAAATSRADMDVFKLDFREACYALTQEQQFHIAGKSAARMFYILRFIEAGEQS